MSFRVVSVARCVTISACSSCLRVEATMPTELCHFVMAELWLAVPRTAVRTFCMLTKDHTPTVPWPWLSVLQ